MRSTMRPPSKVVDGAVEVVSSVITSTRGSKRCRTRSDSSCCHTPPGSLLLSLPASKHLAVGELQRPIAARAHASVICHVQTCLFSFVSEPRTQARVSDPLHLPRARRGDHSPSECPWRPLDGPHGPFRSSSPRSSAPFLLSASLQPSGASLSSFWLELLGSSAKRPEEYQQRFFYWRLTEAINRPAA
jgi:hypothetical protein